MIKPILSLLTVILSLGFSFLYVIPAYEQLGVKQADLKMLNDTIKQTDEIKNIIEQTKKSMDDVTAEEDARFKTFLPEQIDEIRFINNLVHAGAARNILIEGVTTTKVKKGAESINATDSGVLGGLKKVFSPTEQSSGSKSASSEDELRGGYTTTKASFSFIASYPATLLFLGDLEKSLSLVNINSLSFREYDTSEDKKEAKRNGAPIYQSTVEIETYTLK